jgi:hypothetical protein
MIVIGCVLNYFDNENYNDKFLGNLQFCELKKLKIIEDKLKFF